MEVSLAFILQISFASVIIKKLVKVLQPLLLLPSPPELMTLLDDRKGEQQLQQQ